MPGCTCARTHTNTNTLNWHSDTVSDKGIWRCNGCIPKPNSLILSHCQIIFLENELSSTQRFSLIFLYISKSPRALESQALTCLSVFNLNWLRCTFICVCVMFSDCRVSASGELLCVALWACVCSQSQLPAEPQLCKSTVVGGLKSSLMAFSIPSLWETSLWMGCASTSTPPRSLRSREEWWPWREDGGSGGWRGRRRWRNNMGKKQ